jgi:hypothetical protein
MDRVASYPDTQTGLSGGEDLIFVDDEVNKRRHRGKARLNAAGVVRVRKHPDYDIVGVGRADGWSCAAHREPWKGAFGVKGRRGINRVECERGESSERHGARKRYGDSWGRNRACRCRIPKVYIIIAVLGCRSLRPSQTPPETPVTELPVWL